MGHPLTPRIDKECVDFKSFMDGSYPPHLAGVFQKTVEAALAVGITLAISTYLESGEEGLITLMGECNAVWERLHADAADDDGRIDDPND